jgi:hypothetical protein
MSGEVSETLILYRISPTVVRLQVNYAARMNETGNIAWTIVTKGLFINSQCGLI